MRVLLTGLTGFIGSHVGRLVIRDGHELTAIVRPASSPWRIADYAEHVRLLPGELEHVDRISDAIASLRPDVCIHLAWRGGWGVDGRGDRNVDSIESSLNLVRTVVAAGCTRLVVVGTCFEYETGHEVVSEDTPIAPHDLYGASKHAVHVVAEHLTRAAGVGLAWPRIFYTYGPFEDPRRLVPSIVAALRRGEVARTTPGEQVRDYLHVADVAAAIWQIAQSDCAGAVNIASGVPVRVRDVASTVARLLDREDLLMVGALPYRADEPMVLAASGQRLREDIGWSPRYDLQTGLAQTVRWWLDRNHD